MQEAQEQLLQLNKLCHNFKGIVCSNKAIQDSLMSFGLTPAEFLRPFFTFSTLKRLKLGLREKVLNQFTINLIDAQEFFSSTPEQYERCVKEIVTENAPSIEQVSIAKRWKHKVTVEQVIEQNRTKWFHASAAAVADHTQSLFNINFLNQPLVIIYVVSGSTSDNVIKEVDILRKSFQPRLKQMFVNNEKDLIQLSQYILVLNDAQTNKIFNQDGELRENNSGCLCKTIMYNLPSAVPLQVWAKTAKKRLGIPGQQKTGPITILDETTYKQFKEQFEQFSQNQILIKLERNVNVLHSTNLATKSTSSNSVFNLFKGKESQNQEQEYSMSLKEYLLRYLGDVNFLLQEYENAMEYYKHLINELKSNRTNTKLASMNALECYTYARIQYDITNNNKLQKKERDEIFANFSELLRDAQELRQTGILLRLIYHYIYIVIMYQRVDKGTFYQIQSANKYFKGTVDSQQQNKHKYLNLTTTMIFEQIAFLYLRQDPPQFRKFAHNLTLVASRYELDEMKKNSLKSYIIVRSVYAESQWTGILNWLYSHMGANYLEEDKIVEGIDCFKQQMNIAHEGQGNEVHKQILNEWNKCLTSLKQQPRYKDRLDEYFSQSKIDLKIPLVKCPVDIILRDEKIYQLDNLMAPDFQTIIQPKPFIKAKVEWTSLKQGTSVYEENLLKSMDSQYVEEKVQIFNKVPMILNPSRLIDLSEKYSQYGRQAYVDEPITLRVLMENVLSQPTSITDLKVEYEFYTFEQQQQEDLLQIEEKSSDRKLVKTQIPAQNSGLQFAFQKQINVIEITITPHLPGYLTINGLSWKFQSIPVFYPINYDLKDQSKKKSANFFNRFYVMEKSPQLELSLESSFDPEIYLGEMRPVTIILKNNGHKPMNVIVQPLESQHFGFRKLQLQLAPGESSPFQIYIRCSFNESFQAKLFFKYSVQEGVYRYTRIIFPMVAKNSFKFNMSHDQNVERWRFTLSVQDYFKGIISKDASLNFQEIMILNQSWRTVNDQAALTLQNHTDQSFFTTFYLHKLPSQQKITKQVYESASDKFIKGQEDVQTISLGADKSTIPQSILYSFINEDFRNYFRFFYQFDPRDQSFELPLFLVILWTYKEPSIDKVITGMHEIPFMSSQYLWNWVRPNAGDLPVALMMDVQSKYHHNFKDDPNIEVPVKVRVKNTKFPHKIKVRLDFINGDEVCKIRSDVSYPPFVWNGQSSVALELEPLEVVEISQVVWIFESGTYNISRIQITMDQRVYFSSDQETILVQVN